MVDDRSNHVRPVEAIATSAVVIFKVVIELEGLPALERYRAVGAPAILQTLHAPAHVRQVVAENPGEPVGHVEVRRPVFQLGIGAVVRLRCVRLKVLAVAGVIQRLRPHIIHDRSDAMPSVDSVAGLQRVVVRTAGGVLLQHVKGAVGIPGRSKTSAKGSSRRERGIRVTAATEVIDAPVGKIGRINCRRARLIRDRRTAINDDPAIQRTRAAPPSWARFAVGS